MSIQIWSRIEHAVNRRDGLNSEVRLITRFYGRPKKMTIVHYRFIDECMAEDDELAATNVQSLLLEKFPTLNVSLNTIKRARMELSGQQRRQGIAH